MMQDILAVQEIMIIIEALGIDSLLGIRRTGSLTSCKMMEEIAMWDIFLDEVENSTICQ